MLRGPIVKLYGRYTCEFDKQRSAYTSVAASQTVVGDCFAE